MKDPWHDDHGDQRYILIFGQVAGRSPVICAGRGVKTDNGFAVAISKLHHIHEQGKLVVLGNKMIDHEYGNQGLIEFGQAGFEFFKIEFFTMA